MIVRPEVARLLGGLLGQPNDRLKDRLERGVAGHHRLQHRVLGELLSLQLDHQTASAVPATTRSRVESFISSTVGLTLHLHP